MTQVSPTTVLSDQASIVIQNLLDAYKQGTVRDLDEITAKVRDAISSFVANAGTPMSEYDPLVMGEPPSSMKMNRFMNSLQQDVNIMQRQSDFLKASALYLFNIMATEIGLAKNENEKVRNKLKTLELYSSDTDPTIISFAEHFSSDDYIDVEKTAGGSTAAILENSYLTLGRTGETTSQTKSAKVKVLDGSNGLVGNNLEVSQASVPTVDPTTSEAIFSYVGEGQQIDNAGYMVDNVNYTWFEYSAFQVSETDKNKAQQFGFAYTNPKTGGKSVWSNGPGGSDELNLGLQIELTAVAKINQITYMPYGMADNANHPVEVTKIQTSEDGTNWTEVTPSNIWITTNQNIQSLQAADNLSIGTTVWSFPERSAKFIQVFVRQPDPMDVSIGHIYYVDSSTGKRVEGPTPSLDNPRQYYGAASFSTKNLLQKREIFAGKRWGIGIRDIDVSQVKYDAESTLISQPIRVPGVVDRVALDADIYIPSDFNNEDSWVEFYISGDDGVTWEQVSRVTDDFLGIPEIVVFNDPTPDAFKESGVAYVSTTKPVNSLRVKIVLSRPADMTWSTPLIRSYSLRIKKK